MRLLLKARAAQTRHAGKVADGQCAGHLTGYGRSLDTVALVTHIGIPLNGGIERDALQLIALDRDDARACSATRGCLKNYSSPELQ